MHLEADVVDRDAPLPKVRDVGVDRACLRLSPLAAAELVEELRGRVRGRAQVYAKSMNSGPTFLSQKFDSTNTPWLIVSLAMSHSLTIPL